MGENKNNNRRAELYAQSQLKLGMNTIKSGLSEKYDVYTSSQVPNSAIIESNLRNALGVSLSVKQDIYGNRIYGEGSGDYRIADTGDRLEVIESIDHLKFGSVKTDEKEINQEETFFLFRKGSMKGLDGSFKKFCRSAEAYYTVKSIKGAKKPRSNAVFNFYYALVILSLLSVLAFFGFMLYSFIKHVQNPNISILASCIGGTKTIWIAFGASALLWLIGAIVHYTKVAPLRPTGKGMENTDFSMHLFIMVGIELLTIAFAALCVLDNIFGYTIGYLFYPLALACLVYPIFMFILLVINKDTFNLDHVKYLAESLTEEQFKQLQDIELTIINVAVKPDTSYVKDMAVIYVDPDVKVSVWNK